MRKPFPVLAAALVLSIPLLLLTGPLAEALAQGPIISHGHRVIIPLVDGNTDIPGTQVKFHDLSEPVADGINEAFCVIDPVSGNPTGIYLHKMKKIVTIVDTDTLVPGSAETFTEIGQPSISGDNVVFAGGSETVKGIYLHNGRKIVRVVDTSTTVPGTAGTFKNPGAPSISEGNVAFCEFSANGQEVTGIYLHNGRRISTVADLTTPMPGSSETFSFLGGPALSGRNLSFMGGSNTLFGIYLYSGGKLWIAADTGTDVPGSSSKFRGFITYGENLSGGNVVFIGFSDTGQGVYRYGHVGRSLIKVADTDTLIPGTAETFLQFDTPAVSGNHVAFTAQNAAWETTGIYLFDGRKLVTVVDTDTDVPGSNTKFSNMSRPILRGGNVAFTTLDSDYSPTGIYLSGHALPCGGRRLSTVVDTHTAIPGSSGTFSRLGDPVPSEAGVIFTGGSTGYEGIYLVTPLH